MDIGRLKMNIRGAPASPFEGPEGAFDEVAAHVGAPLPKSYIEFIRETDGGHPEISCFTPDKTNPNNVFGVDTFYSENPKERDPYMQIEIIDRNTLLDIYDGWIFFYKRVSE